MNSGAIPGTLFDGDTLRGLPVELAVAAGRLASMDSARTVDVSLADVRISDRLADVPRFLYLPGNRTVETTDNAAIDALLSLQQRGRHVRFVHSLESHARIAAVATVLLVVLTATALWWGLPVLAYRAAMAVPAAIEYQAGRAGLASFNKLLGVSGLTRLERQRVQAQLDRLMLAGALDGKPELVFRSMGGKFPNAFALPGGFIVMSDELVKLAESDDEVAAVLAHEIGHWQRRHGLQIVLRNSAALLVVCTVTGDLSTLTTFAGTIPFTLLQRGYSREFEAEADAYAVQLLLQANADPRFFASLLEKLAESRPDQGNDLSYLGTHPGTAQRISSVFSAAERQGWRNPGPLPPSTQPAAAKTPLHTINVGTTNQTVEPHPDVAPKIVDRPAPFYPAKLRAEGKAGSVTVEFIINETGAVRDVTVVRSSDKEFEMAAIVAVAKWKFEPGRKNGRAVKIRASQRLDFDPNEEPPPSPAPPAQ